MEDKEFRIIEHYGTFDLYGEARNEYWRVNNRIFLHAPTEKEIGEAYNMIDTKRCVRSHYLTRDDMSAKERKEAPVGTGVVDYFPDALIAIAQCSFVGNEQHNPGSELHWDRSKSGDEGDALLRHFIDRGKIDKDGIRHSAKMAWRALALLQKEIENHKEGPRDFTINSLGIKAQEQHNTTNKPAFHSVFCSCTQCRNL